MKISLNWVKEYVDLEGIPDQEIISGLTMAGLEVEDVVNEKEIYKGFIVGFVKTKAKHPNADKLSLCTVSTGEKDFQVICGAPNVEAGQKVVFAPIGTIIPKGNFQISKAKIRGVESFGMICSEAELELSDNHEGIMVLTNGFKEGTPITEALELNDIILEIGITPNRPDALSHIGVARDLAAVFDRKFEYPEIEKSEKEPGKKTEKFAEVDLVDTENCPRYAAKVITGITVKDSPEWLKKRIKKIGMRPINSIVDITNFVMYEYGQPLHAFDLDLIKGKKIVVRSTEKESAFTTLDSKERKLPPGTLMICDAEKPVAVAGVMGGENSEIINSTKNILIESAYFNPGSVRRTSRALGLSTDASYRFERGIDPSTADIAAERAAQLIVQYAGGEAKPLINVYPVSIKEKEVGLRFERVPKILGYRVSKEKINYIVQKLGFKILLETENEVRLAVPTFRPDIEREIDVIEEIARIHGYNNIPAVNKITVTLTQRFDDSQFKDEIRNTASALGFLEMINNPLQDLGSASLTGNPIKILNPLSNDLAYLRTSLIPGALQTVARNLNSGEKDLLLYEIGNVFNKISEGSIESFSDFTEEEKLIFLISGRINGKEWHSEEKIAGFFHLKGAVDSFLTKISLDNILNDSYYDSANSIYDFYYAKTLSDKITGLGGKISKDVLRKFDVSQDVFCFEFSTNLLKDIERKEKRYSEPVKYPKVIRDFAFVFDKSLTFGEVKNFIQQNGSKLLKSVTLFDIFQSESLGSDKQSLAFTLEYYSEDRTLTEEEVDKEFQNLIKAVTKKFNAKLRGA
ncbi:MAG TPA: phenylalanine--tRNA ligase subunit beta [Ignavibacteriaceae bacterium]|nr:phenylalanine--tRNA ligase subunit beta [Ignavibacteriaceae bacterium]